MPTCPKCGETSYEDDEDDLSSAMTRPIRRSAFGADWLSGLARIKDATIEEIALSVIYFSLQGEAAEDHIHKLVEERVPIFANRWEAERIVRGRVHVLKAQRYDDELERSAPGTKAQHD